MNNKIETNIELNKEDFSFVCPMKQEDMREVDGGFFCDKCEEKVHDVSHMSQGEYEELIETNDNVCVTFKRVVAASFAFGLVACAEPKQPKPVLMGKIIAPSKACQTQTIKKQNKNPLAPYKVTTNKTVEVAGGIMAQPEKKIRTKGE
jgi:hypothetical protein